MITSPSAFLVQYGRSGFVGRFGSPLEFARGNRVVIRGPRGVELGDVLLRLDDSGEDGEILREATEEDGTTQRTAETLGQTILNAASDAAIGTGLPLTFVDIEVTLNRVAILHALPWDTCDASPLFEDLSAQFGLAIQLLDLSRQLTAPDVPDAGCGKPGCGSKSGGCSTCSTGSGCSTGSCSRGSVKSPEELTAYFVELRKKMEAAGLTRTALN